MANFDQRRDGLDQGGDDAPTPVINGGLLDPRTFPTPWPPAVDYPAVDPQPPRIAGPLDTDVHAEVLRDILAAQAKLPPVPRPAVHTTVPGPISDHHWLDPRPRSPADAATHTEVLRDVKAAQAKLPPLRHIDPYPGMNYAPPGRFAAPTHQDMLDFARGVPVPNAAYGPHITFVNDEVRKPSTDRPVTSSTAAMVEHAVVDSGFHSVNMNSTVRPPDGSNSNHPKMRAVDINRIDGWKVINRPDLGAVLQAAFARQPMIRENFGPGYQVSTRTPGLSPQPVRNVAEGHRNHDHFSAQQ